MDVLVVGAGVAGLCAARDLADAGREVVVVDKGRAVGGRMASWRDRDGSGARFDHGAQFFTAKGERFTALVDAAVAAGVASTWFHGAPDADTTDPQHQEGDGHPRHRGVPHQRAVAEWLADGLDMRTSTRLVDLEVLDDGDVAAHTEDGARFRASAAVVTTPVPQALELLRAGRTRLPEQAASALATIAYDPCIALLVTPEQPLPPIGREGAVRLGGEPFAWVADNAAKGTSERPAVTLHLGPATSRALYDASDDEVAAEVLGLAEDLLGAPLTLRRRHGWRYSQPSNDPLDGACVAVGSPPNLVFAGDAFAGGRVEGAATSGWAAAEHLLA